jgi:hypothetical protein
MPPDKRAKVKREATHPHRACEFFLERLAGVLWQCPALGHLNRGNNYFGTAGAGGVSSNKGVGGRVRCGMRGQNGRSMKWCLPIFPCCWLLEILSCIQWSYLWFTASLCVGFPWVYSSWFTMTVLLLVVCRDLRGRFDFIFSRGQNLIYGEYIKWGCRCSERLRTKAIVEEMKCRTVYVLGYWFR